MASSKSSSPNHIAIIMDGNGRWANSQGKERTVGHESGLNSVKEAIRGCIKNDVKYLTLYAFSTENWKRPESEVNFLMSLMVKAIESEAKELIENGVKVMTIGDLTALPKETRDSIDSLIKDTSKGEKLNLMIALNYGSREEIKRAVEKIAIKIQDKNISVQDINTDLISSCLDTANIPDPDILIRTSNEKRLSNFLLWQLAYTEFIFLEKMWPEFKEEDIKKCIDTYCNRERRYGMTGDQLN